MIRRKSKIVVTDSWFVAAAGQASEKDAAISANSASKNATPATFVEKSTNGKSCDWSMAELAELPTNPQDVEKQVAVLAESSQSRQSRRIASSSPPVKGGLKEGVIREAGVVGDIQNPAGVCPHCLGTQPDAADIASAGAGHCRECWVTWGRAIPLHRGAAA